MFVRSRNAKTVVSGTRGDRYQTLQAQPKNLTNIIPPKAL
jgi:hypothetical protein